MDLQINIDFDINLLVQLLLFVKLTNSALELCSELLAIFLQPEMEVDVGNDQRLLKVCFSLNKYSTFFRFLAVYGDLCL